MNTTNTQGKGLGANISQPDARAILIARVQAPVVRPKQYYFDDSQVPTEDQKEKGTCVGQAEGGEIECRELRDTGKVTPVSKRWIYNQSKFVDGYSGEGTFPTVTAEIKVKKGAPKKEYCPDDNSLPYAEYIKIPLNSQEVKDDAAIRVAAGYGFVQAIQEDILQAIFQNGSYTATLQCGDWSMLPVKPIPSRGNHRIRFNGYREIPGDAIIWFRNSWGVNWANISSDLVLNEEEKKKVARGDGCFLFSQYKDFIFEQLVFADVPYAMIMEARNKKYTFLRDLKYTMIGTDVMELQKRLAKEIAKDGIPCYRYPNSSNQIFTTYFGSETEAASKRYQLANGLVGDGKVGPKTRAKLNEQVVPPTPPVTPILPGVGKKIVLNAGHHNTDPGAVTLQEATEVKLIRDQAVIALRAAGFEVFAVSDDKDLSASIAYANQILPKHNDGLCIDIHLNASGNKNARGTEGYHGTSATSKKIAEAMASNVSRALGFTNRGAFSDTTAHVGSLGWIRNTKAWATLVEVGFITNVADMAILRGPDGYKKAGEGIAQAVKEIFGV